MHTHCAVNVLKGIIIFWLLIKIELLVLILVSSLFVASKGFLEIIPSCSSLTDIKVVVDSAVMRLKSRFALWAASWKPTL